MNFHKENSIKTERNEEGFLLISLMAAITISMIILANSLWYMPVKAFEKNVQHAEQKIRFMYRASGAYFTDNYPYATPTTFPNVTVALLKATAVPSSASTYVDVGMDTTIFGTAIGLTSDGAGVHLTARMPTGVANAVLADISGTVQSVAGGFTVAKFDMPWPTSPRDSHLYRRDGTLPMTADIQGGGFSLVNVQDVTAAGVGTFGSIVSNGQITTKTNTWGLVAQDAAGTLSSTSESQAGSLNVNDVFVRSKGRWLSQLLPSMVQKNIFLVVNNSLVTKPVCTGGGIAKIVVTPQVLLSYNGAANNTGLDIEMFKAISINATTWRVSILNFKTLTTVGGGLGLASTYCSY